MESAAKGESVVRGRAKHETPQPGEILTLGRLAELNKENGFHGRSAKYKKEQPKKVERIVDFLGADFPVVALSKSNVEAFTAHRVADDHARQNTIAGDLHALKIALNWATEFKRRDGEPLLEVNPLARLKIQHEKSPRRPRADADRYHALKDVADKLPPAFGLALDLAWETGHRISAILALKWEDVILDAEEAALLAAELDDEVVWSSDHFPKGGIHWYAGLKADNKKHEHVSPLNAAARRALERVRPDIVPGTAWVFPAPKDSSKPLGYHVAKRWLERAEKLADIPHLKGGGWHAFRRASASARKHLPPGDVARGGGWWDVATMQRSYQQADGDTVLQVVMNS